MKSVKFFLILVVYSRLQQIAQCRSGSRAQSHTHPATQCQIAQTAGRLEI